MSDTETLPPPVRVVNEQGTSPYVLICEHASRFIPQSFAGLGLGEADLKRHIAWDIGAENVARFLSQHLDATLVLAGYSRLLIDLNRPTGSSSSIPEISETTIIPGNAGLTAAQRDERVRDYFIPFQQEVENLLDRRLRVGRPAIIAAIHSFTPVYRSVERSWHAGILYRRSQRFGAALVDALGGAGAKIAHNEPYQIEDDSDYTIPTHGERRGLEAVLIEIRQDLIADDESAAGWANRLSAALKTCEVAWRANHLIM